MFHDENRFNLLKLVSGKVFNVLEMRAIDSPHRKTPRQPFFRRKSECWFIFASLHPAISLNQGSIFLFRQCAQSIPRIENPYRVVFVNIPGK